MYDIMAYNYMYERIIYLAEALKSAPIQRDRQVRFVPWDVID